MGRTLKVGVPKVKQQDANLPSIISINDPSSSRDTELSRLEENKTKTEMKAKVNGRAPSPLLGATRPYVPAGTAMEMSVFTIALPRAEISVFSALPQL